MQRLAFLSITSGLLALGCGGDDECGPGDAPDTGLVASSADVTLTYGNLTSGRNNDCPDPNAPEGIISLTINGTQMGAAGNLITLCIPRPDLVEDGLQIGTSGSNVRVPDFNGEANGCTFSIAMGSVPTGTVRATGFCDNGTNAAGYALTIDGNLLLRRVCPTATDMIAVAVSGTVAVKSLD